MGQKGLGKKEQSECQISVELFLDLWICLRNTRDKCERCQWGQFYSKIVPGELKHSRGDRKQKSYLKMAVAWPEPDMGLLIQTYENRLVLTKSNVKSEKNLKEFSVLWLLKDAKSW